MAVVFLFIDGVGLGPAGPHNPLTETDWEGFGFMAGGRQFSKEAEPVQKQDHLFKAIGATLGVEGLPQSGTGQATLFSGENAARHIGKHFGPFPHSGTKPLLREQSLFTKARNRGRRCMFINAYPPIFFSKAEKRNRWSCTTLMARSAGIPLNTTADVRNEKAVTAGLTQQAWREKLGIDVPVIEPEEAAGRLLTAAASHDLVLHEYYLTDKAGHSQQKELADGVINRYDRFLREMIASRPDDVTIVLCSDHGNVEDLSIKTHTLNRVPLFILGPGARAFEHAESIRDVTPGILEIL